jgi:hypothetical protein
VLWPPAIAFSISRVGANFYLKENPIATFILNCYLSDPVSLIFLALDQPRKPQTLCALDPQRQSENRRKRLRYKQFY